MQILRFLVRNESANLKESVSSSKQLPSQQIQETPKRRTSIFSRIFGRKAQPEEQNAEESNRGKAGQVAGKKPAEPQYIKKTVSKLKSINYSFKKIDGLNEKCKQLVSTEYGILASTNKGLYNISDHVAKAIVKNRYINFISEKSKDNKYYVAAGDGYFYVILNYSTWSVGYPDKTLHNQFIRLSAQMKIRFGQVVMMQLTKSD